jgi:ribosome-associated heat shock protein Hsp15
MMTMANKARHAAAHDHSARQPHDNDDDNASATSQATSQQGARHGASTRLDKWLWAARFYKTRSLATEAVTRGRVQVNDQAVKPSREVRVGDLVSVRQGDMPMARVVRVLGLSEVRGPAPVAQALYVQTPESVVACAAWAEQRRLAPEPAHAITDGRPTKQARRDLADWQRWSASLDED